MSTRPGVGALEGHLNIWTVLMTRDARRPNRRTALVPAFAVTIAVVGWSVAPTALAAGHQRVDTTAQCFGRAATIVGTAKDDDIVGTDGNDVVVTFGGDDTVSGEGGDDFICTGDGNDEIDAGTGSDHVDGAAGDDQIDGGQGADMIDGGDDND